MKIIDVFVCKLRRKLNEAHPGAGVLIQTTWGQGYSLAGNVAAEAA
jgi:DNA-binding response OmpR family regulator